MARKRRRQDPRKMSDQFKQDASSGKFIKHQSGHTLTLRFLPPWNPDSDQWYLKQLLHYGFKDLDNADQGRTIPCMKYHYDMPFCPVCQIVEFLYGNTDIVGAEALARELGGKKRFLLNALQQTGDNKYEFGIYGAGPMVMNQLTGYLSKPGYGDITDEDSGWWMYIEKSGQGFNTSYDCSPVPKSDGPIPVKDWDVRLHDLSSEIPQLTYEQAYRMLSNRLAQDHPGLVEQVCPHPSEVEGTSMEEPSSTKKKATKKKATKKATTKKATTKKKAGGRR